MLQMNSDVVSQRWMQLTFQRPWVSTLQPKSFAVGWTLAAEGALGSRSGPPLPLGFSLWRLKWTFGLYGHRPMEN
jgi:hypothetical protein